MEVKPYKNKLSLKNKLHRYIWNIIYKIFFRYTLNCMNKWRIYILSLFGAKIGCGSYIHASTKIWAPWNLEIGENSCIYSNVNCYNPGKIKIGNNVIISAGVFVCTPSHDISDSEFPMIPSTITIKDYTWIAPEAFIGPKVTIGEQATVEARACVFKDVAPGEIVLGNPATPLKKL